MKKCIVLFSGGLDSRLAVKIMKKAKYNVTALHFQLPFSKNIKRDIKKFCEKEKANLKIFDCTKGKLFKEYLKIIKKPKYKRGTCLNPCIDCRIFLLKKAKKFADAKKIKSIVTGEINEQRPMSQTAYSLNLIEKESELKNRILRPLSDENFPYKIKGRRRDKQIALAKKFKIKYPDPAGGCLLCEKLYCEKLKKILNKELNFKDIQLLKIGRHFKSSKIILGRDKKENTLLEKEKKIKVIPKQPGATALVKEEKLVSKAKKLIQKYSKNKIKEFEVK